jgi:predicted double-glycine peptidase
MNKMKKLKIRRFLQKASSKDCGPASTQAILDYYGIKKSAEELSKHLTYADLGTSLYDNGTVVLKNGLRAVAITANPILFSFADRVKLKTKLQVEKHLAALAKSKAKELKDKKLGIKIFQRFLKSGGEVRLAIPRFEHIRSAIDAGHPVLALVYPRAFGSYDRFFHFVVVHGYDSRFVYISDPLPSAKKNKVPIDDFMYGLHSSACGDVDNGSLLIVSKK